MAGRRIVWVQGSRTGPARDLACAVGEVLGERVVFLLQRGTDLAEYQVRNLETQPFVGFTGDPDDYVVAHVHPTMLQYVRFPYDVWLWPGFSGDGSITATEPADIAAELLERAA